MKTELNNRTLWFDGTNAVEAALVPDLLLAEVPLNRIAVSSPNEDVTQFNLINEQQLLAEKTENDPLNLEWNIPERYQTLELDAYLATRLVEKIIGKIDGGAEAEQLYLNRVQQELHEIRSRDIEPLIRTLIFVVEEFRNSGTVWGVGRGSSCASLVLFLIGLHAVDPIKYGIPLSEFFHD